MPNKLGGSGMSRFLIFSGVVVCLSGVVTVGLLGAVRIGEAFGLIAIGLFLAAVSIVLRLDVKADVGG